MNDRPLLKVISVMTGRLGGWITGQFRVNIAISQIHFMLINEILNMS